MINQEWVIVVRKRGFFWNNYKAANIVLRANRGELGCSLLRAIDDFLKITGEGEVTLTKVHEYED